MLRQIDAYASLGLVVAGVLDIAPRLEVPMADVNQLWFVGAGLALGLLGLLNLIRISTKMSVVVLICAVTNVIGSLYLLNVARMLPTPLVLVVLAMMLISTLCSLVPRALARPGA